MATEERAQKDNVHSPERSSFSKHKPLFKMHEFIILKNGKIINTQGSWNENGQVKYVIDGKIFDEIAENAVDRIESPSTPIGTHYKSTNNINTEKNCYLDNSITITSQ